MVPEVPRDFDVSAPLRDGSGRALRYLRLSLTDRCDMACVYCMPEGGEAEHGLRRELLSFEEIARLVGLLASLGIVRVRLTGGEPLLRKDVPNLVARIRRAGIEDVWLTTNGSRLASLARPLAEAGLVGVNVSLDSLDSSRFRRITRSGSLEQVLAGIDAALAAGLAVRTNTVVLRDENDEELDALVRWAWSRGIVPRFIELMPIGEGARLGTERFVAASEMRARLERELGEPLVDRGHERGRGPARYACIAARPACRVGFITAVSDEFCTVCDRLRVTALGELRGCLASRRAVSLRDAMRAGASDRELVWALVWALAGKAAGHGFARGARRAEGAARVDEDEHRRVGMSLVGG